MSAPKDCRSVENELALFVGGELGPHARADVEQHLVGCPVCTRAVERFEASRAALRAGLARPESLAPDLWQGIRARLVQSGTIRSEPALPVQESPVAPLRRMPRWIPISVAAAALFALGLWLLQRGDAEALVVPGGSNLVVTAPQPKPLQVQPVGLRRLAPGESALSDSATTIDELQEEARLRAALQPGGAQAASQHRGIH